MSESNFPVFADSKASRMDSIMISGSVASMPWSLFSATTKREIARELQQFPLTILPNVIRLARANHDQRLFAYSLHGLGLLQAFDTSAKLATHGVE